MKKVLVVDDDIVMFRLFQVQVKRAGCEGFFFRDGKAAMAELEAIKPDLAVLDYNMPGVNGSDLFHALRDNPATAEIPVIFVTGTANDADLQAIRALGASEILAKPFSPRRLQSLIKQFLQL